MQILVRLYHVHQYRGGEGGENVSFYAMPHAIREYSHGTVLAGDVALHEVVAAYPVTMIVDLSAGYLNKNITYFFHLDIAML